jgi:hypothetical protein
MGRDMSIFQIGESPYRYGVHSNLGTNRCTSLCQPVDVDFNKPFKDRMRRQWINWMTNEGVVHGTASPPARLDVAKWVHAAMLEMKGRGDIIRNAWKRHDCEWFLNDENSREQNVGTHDDGVEEGAV